eukprot:547142-Rhodomonas_salina.1
MMCKALAKIGSWPTHMRSDGSAEYNSPEVSDLFKSNNIEHEWSNPGEQHTNGAAETLVNRLGRCIRVLLLFSGLAPEFWGLALVNVVDVYNCLPHSSLKFEIQYALQFGRAPDVSWFRTFGCSTVVHQGKNLVEHHKIAPRGESG